MANKTDEFVAMTEKLISVIKEFDDDSGTLPYSVYTSIKEQYLLNVPVIKPLLIAVLEGNKELGKHAEIQCSAGSFVFLSDSPAIDMRNIPNNKPYFALLIEFEYQDFAELQVGRAQRKRYIVGEINQTLDKCLQQFVEWSQFAPKSLWAQRRREILQLLCLMGHKEILAMATNGSVGHRLHALLSNQKDDVLSTEKICEQLAMSESTLRRKLKSEGTTIQEVKDQVKLGLGLHLLQTTQHSIGYIAQQCGYHSQSRFTQRFKGRFGLTPSELRNTKMKE